MRSEATAWDDRAINEVKLKKLAQQQQLQQLQQLQQFKNIEKIQKIEQNMSVLTVPLKYI
jgi:hypothetical protein